MIDQASILTQLAALFYYGSGEKAKGVSFEQLEEGQKRPFVSLAEATLVSIDKLNLMLVPKSTKNEEEVEALLRDRIESAIRDFSAGLHKSHKAGSIPWEDLVARIWSIWKTL